MSICKEKPDNLSLLEVIGKRPGPRSFQTAITGSSALALPSAPATARQVEGTRILRDEFDVTAQQGKFWYAPSVFRFLSIEPYLLSYQVRVPPPLSRLSRYSQTHTRNHHFPLRHR